MRILITDDEAEIAEIVKLHIEEIFPTDTEIFTANSGSDAIKILTEYQIIDLCICDHNMLSGTGADVIRYIIQNKLETKFVLCSTVSMCDHFTDYPEEAVFFNIEKPDIKNGVDGLFIKLTEKNRLSFDGFVPIPIKLLALMRKVPGDIYIRVSDDKFIKCINEWDEFTAKDEEKYRLKEINNLFIKKIGTKNSFNDTVLVQVQETMNRHDIAIHDRISAAHSFLIGLIKFNGINADLAEASKRNIYESISLVMGTPLTHRFWTETNFMVEYSSSLYALQSMLAAVVVQGLHRDSKAQIFKIMLAAFLQDISLDSAQLMEIGNYQEFLDKQAQFSEHEIKKFQEHHLQSRRLFAAFKEVPADVERLLAEQYEMPTGDGFPKKLNAMEVAPLSCTFIITGLLARYILKSGQQFDFDFFIKDLESKGYSRGYYRSPFEALKSSWDRGFSPRQAIR